jgi:hypothetical protein
MPAIFATVDPCLGPLDLDPEVEDSPGVELPQAATPSDATTTAIPPTKDNLRRRRDSAEVLFILILPLGGPSTRPGAIMQATRAAG